MVGKTVAVRPLQGCCRSSIDVIGPVAARIAAVIPHGFSGGPTLGISGFARGLPVAVGLCSQIVGLNSRTQSVLGVVMGLELLGARLGLQQVDAPHPPSRVQQLELFLNGISSRGHKSQHFEQVVHQWIALSPECSLPLACTSPQLRVPQILFAVPHCAAPSPMLVIAVPLHFSAVKHARPHELILS